MAAFSLSDLDVREENAAGLGLLGGQLTWGEGRE